MKRCEPEALGHFYPPDKKFSVFIGRKSSLAMLRSKFFPNGEPTRASCRKSLVVYGMGGSGKTELSAEFAHESKHLYAAVFTIRAASNDTVADSLAKIGELAGLQPTENSGRHFLSQISATYLLMIDNADNPDMDLRALYPTNHATHILITTRSPNFRLQGELGCIKLGGLEQEEALWLLLTQADIPEPWDSETTATGNLITQTLGYLALALIHAGTCILEKVCSLSKYLEVHKEARERIRKENMSICSSDAEKNICVKLYSSFEVSMNTLETASADVRQDALDLLKILCFYHFENVPIEIFPRAVKRRLESLQQEKSASWLGAFGRRRLEPGKLLPSFLKGQQGSLEKYRVNYAIAKLRLIPLVSYDGYFVSLHPLVYAWVRDNLSVVERRVWVAVALNTLMQSISLPPEGNSEDDGQFHREILPHLQTCLQEHGSPTSPFIRGMGSLRFSAAKLLQPTVFYTMAHEVQMSAKCRFAFTERGLLAQARHHFLETTDVLTRALGHGHEKTMAVMVALAGVYWGLGRLDDAISLQSHAVREKSRILGPEHE
ncbi:hypothetical protein J3459_012792 [Metarhizium acridum]|nr:hypothetical protein J3459_012792 [Metarhizium acridum]